MDTNQQHESDPVAEGIDKAIAEFLERSENERTELADKAGKVISRAEATAAKLDRDDVETFLRNEEIQFAEEADELLLKYLEDSDSVSEEV